MCCGTATPSRAASILKPRFTLLLWLLQVSSLPQSKQVVVCGCVSDKQVMVPAVFTESALETLQVSLAT